MSPIVERLRDIQQYGVHLSDPARSTVGQAADEIERLMLVVVNLQQQKRELKAVVAAYEAGTP